MSFLEDGPVRQRGSISGSARLRRGPPGVVIFYPWINARTLYTYTDQQTYVSYSLQRFEPSFCKKNKPRLSAESRPVIFESGSCYCDNHFMYVIVCICLGVCKSWAKFLLGSTHVSVGGGSITWRDRAARGRGSLSFFLRGRAAARTPRARAPPKRALYTLSCT